MYNAREQRFDGASTRENVVFSLGFDGEPPVDQSPESLPSLRRIGSQEALPILKVAL